MPAQREYPILYVDDESDNLSTFDLNFGDDFQVLTAESGPEALRTLNSKPVAVLVVDQRMPGMSGLETLERAKQEHPELVGVLLTAYREIEVLVEAVNSGHVYRYVQKPWDRRELAHVLEQAIEHFHLKQQNARLLTQLESMNAYLRGELESRGGSGELVGNSARLREAVGVVERVAPTLSTVLITGESGTGKELAARAIHHNSPRRDAPFVRVNLSSLAPTLLESELFGHEKGAFTGAVSQRAGRLELASGGTLFLDEIGELAPEMQVKLLRVLQEREFERVGGTRTVQVDFRLICATNKNLEKEVQEGRFREDLYYRVRVFPIHMPALRDRLEDIPLLAAHFLRSFSTRVGRAFAGFTPDALGLLMSYDWPGNVRELENVVERAMILSAGPDITAVDLEFLRPASAVADAEGLPEYLGKLESARLEESLRRNGGSVSKVAKELGIQRTTLYYRLKKYGLVQ